MRNIQFLGAFLNSEPIYYPFWFLRDLIWLSIISGILIFVLEQCPIVMSASIILIFFGVIPWQNDFVRKVSFVYYSIGCFGALYFTYAYKISVLVYTKTKLLGITLLVLILLVIRNFSSNSVITLLYILRDY